MRAPLPHQLPYRADIDGLRAFAVLSVILFHAYPIHVEGGFVGVDIFFVISGFLISSLLLDSAKENKFSIVDFYKRRIRRILPALILVLCAVFCAGWFLLLPTDFSDLNKLILSSLIFIPNFRLLTEAGYFAPNANFQPLLHLWSLGVEEQFYLFWPVLVAIFWKKGLPWVIVSLAVASFIANILLIGNYPDAAFYLPVTRLWELLAGSYLAWRERRHLHSGLGTATGLPGWLREALSILGITILLGCDKRLYSTFPFPGWWALLPVLSAMMVIAAGPQAWLNRHVLAHRSVVFIGLISYPLYLWHWPILAFMRMRTVNYGEAAPLAKGVGLFVAVLLAWLTYRFVEKPIRRLKPGASDRGRVLALLAGSLILAFVSTAVIAARGVPKHYPAKLQPFLTYDYLALQPYVSDHPCFLEAQQDGSDWNQNRCIEPQTTPAEPLLVFWGDSHAAPLRFGLTALQRNRKFRIGEMTQPGCPPLVNVDVPIYLNCRSLNDFYLKKIIQLRPDIVVLSASWPDRIAPLEQTIRILKQAKIRHIVVIGPVPLWRDVLPRMLAHAALLDGGRVPMQLGPDSYETLSETELKLLVEKEGATYVSAKNVLCPAGQCVTMTAYGPQYVTFADTNHLSVAGSQLLVRGISDELFDGIDVAKR